MSDLLDPLFGDPEVGAHFTDLAQLQAMLDVEVALAEALAEVGMIPESAVAAITQAARAESFDRAALARGTARSGNLAIPMVVELTARVAAIDAAAAHSVHRGATSQDILDTGLVLQLRGAVAAIVRRLARAEDTAADLARRHRDAVMPGRTWLQHATPVTFGFKAAGWCDGLGRVRARVADAGSAATVLQFGGASGTLAALGDRGLAVAEALGSRLALPVPAIPWHAHRDRLVNLGCALGLATGVLGKIGRDIALLAQTEVAEATEADPGGSSTMPQKRNPIAASVAIAAAIRAPGLVATLLAAMTQEHERGIGGWQAEWETLPALVRLTGGAARAIADALEALVVDPGRMRANLELSNGLIHAEAVATALAAKIGKPRAQALVTDACRRAARDGDHLRIVVAADPEISAQLPADELDTLFEAARYLGSTATLIDRVLGQRGPTPNA